MNRRQFIKQGSVFLSTMGCFPPIELEQQSTSTSQCALTPMDIEGPYYVTGIPIRNDFREDEDTEGLVELQGQVLDQFCTPISGAVLHIWHANRQGQYDLGAGQRRYYGQFASGEDGRYIFHSIYPGAYATSRTTYRPRHYHLKVFLQGQEVLTSQIYFKNDQYLRYEPNHPSNALVHLEREDKILRGSFNIVIQTS